jgi:hypothetical protein
MIERLGVTVWRGDLTGGEDGAPPRLAIANAEAKPILASPLRYAPILWNNQRAERRVAIYRAETRSDWQRIIFDHVAECCVANGFETVEIALGAEAEYSPDFYRRSVADPAARMVVLANDDTARLFLLQAAHYQRLRCLIIGENFVYPEAVGPDGGTPSIQRSLDQFLADSHLGQVASDHNSGWATIWRELETRLIRAV